MKRAFALILSAVFALCFAASISGCAKKDPALYDLACGQVAAMHREGDEPAASIKVIETDDHGRILFKATKSGSTFYNGHLVAAYIVCQYNDEDTAYCYPDICYELTDGGELSKERLDALKERNDWNKEIDRDKCKAETDITYEDPADEWLDEMFYAHADVEKAFVKNLFFGRDSDGKKLYVTTWIKNRGSENNEYGLYLIVVDRLFQFIAIEKVDEPLEIASYILKIKEETGWR